ncbi:uncharacterized protein METZ01_LOCUS492226 [marine metagenome]|uniref:Uncharacterized protein n=1 Tax=marine metagenome TaxID=408172 RepID=A0A383D4H0_9ZZZZ
MSYESEELSNLDRELMVLGLSEQIVKLVTGKARNSLAVMTMHG